MSIERETESYETSRFLLNNSEVSIFYLFLSLVGDSFSPLLRKSAYKALVA